MLGNENLIAPYLQWATLTQFAYLEGDWFRVLLEVERSVSSFISTVKSLNTERDVIIPAIYDTAPRDLQPADVTFCMGIMSRRALELLAEKSPGDSGAEKRLFQTMRTLAGSIRSIELCTSITVPRSVIKPAPKKSKPARIKRQKVVAQAARPNVVIGIIDDGLAFAHERFRFSNGNTRFKYFLNQDDVAFASPGPGREFTEADINKLLQQCRYANTVDEDQVYQLAGQNLVGRGAKHGTHVMDIACGLDPKDAGADAPYLIGVQLPKWVTQETSGALLTGPAHYAISYIVNRADQIAAELGTALLPIVINLSYGNIAGPHDGTAPLEIAIDQLIAARPTPLRVVVPAGNHYLARCHSRFDLAASTSADGSTEKLHWRVQPDDKAMCFMEIWLPLLAPDRTRPQVAVRLTAPTGESSPWVQPGTAWPPSGTTNIRFGVQSVDLTGQRPHILLSLVPTATMETNLPVAPSGTWLVEVENLGSPVTVDAWVQRGDTPFGYPLWGRQSRFDDDDGQYHRFDHAGRLEEEDIGASTIRRRGSLNALATEQRAIVIGGFRRSDCRPSRYSGAGPVSTPPATLPPRNGPDAAAVADDSVALHGVLAAGTRTGSVVAMDGTSIAAPQVTRLIAEWMKLGQPSDRAAVQQFAATRDSCPPPTAPKLRERIGAGRIELPPRVAKRWQRW